MKNFAFSFPSSESVSMSFVTEEHKFWLRMGFSISHVIKKDYKNREAGDIERAINVSIAIDRCKAMFYDTGLVLCMLDQVSSNVTSGTTYYFIMSLHPDGSHGDGRQVLPGIFQGYHNFAVRIFGHGVSSISALANI